MLLLSAALGGQDGCLPCEPPESVRAVLEESFRTILALPDCAGAENLKTCRALEGELASALEAIEQIVRSRRDAEKRCLSCDPEAGLAPLVDGLLALGRMLVEKGYDDFASARGRMEELASFLDGTRCCGAPEAPEAVEAVEAVERPPATTPEEDARAVLLEKCGSGFVDNRRGLRQVVRAPGAGEGCYQSRACRKPSSESGTFIQAGYWTYDGEYWYVWAERRTPRGEWTACEG